MVKFTKQAQLIYLLQELQTSHSLLTQILSTAGCFLELFSYYLHLSAGNSFWSNHNVKYLQCYLANQICCCNRAVFSLVSKLISELLWFCIAALRGWLQKISHHFFNQSEVKSKPILPACVFPHLTLAACICCQPE